MATGLGLMVATKSITRDLEMIFLAAKPLVMGTLTVTPETLKVLSSTT
jgi:hypothetical protein